MFDALLEVLGQSVHISCFLTIVFSHSICWFDRRRIETIFPQFEGSDID